MLILKTKIHQLILSNTESNVQTTKQTYFRGYPSRPSKLRKKCMESCRARSAPRVLAFSAVRARFLFLHSRLSMGINTNLTNTIFYIEEVNVVLGH